MVVFGLLHEDFGNGRDYYHYHGRRLAVVSDRRSPRPARQYRDWLHVPCSTGRHDVPSLKPWYNMATYTRGGTMPIAVPVRDLKDTARFCKTVRESDGAVIVTRNGYDEFVALTPERYHEYEMALRRQDLYESVDAAEGRLASGQGVEGRSALVEIRARRGL